MSWNFRNDRKVPLSIGLSEIMARLLLSPGRSDLKSNTVTINTVSTYLPVNEDDLRDNDPGQALKNRHSAGGWFARSTACLPVQGEWCAGRQPHAQFSAHRSVLFGRSIPLVGSEKL
ncbi:MAG: hypothetical protein HKN85_01175 [Gammaproteobacteria bacterium]|nr:hypothetical protein [Gammaproteobacteria bacterium]